jgi:methylphosphotriester-DNA--protein-cysteine methyltransferase
VVLTHARRTILLMQNLQRESHQRCRTRRREGQPASANCEDYKHSHAFIMHRWIRKNHGHTKLSFEDMAHWLEIDLRTLQRVFRAAYGISMKSYATSERIRFVHATLSSSPETKLSALASELGYESDKAFIRFVSQHASFRRSPNPVLMSSERTIQKSA